jgi:hypothetical protein
MSTNFDANDQCMEPSELERRCGQASHSPYSPHLDAHLQTPSQSAYSPYSPPSQSADSPYLGAHLQAPQVTINRVSGGGGVFEEPLVQVKKKHPIDKTDAGCKLDVESLHAASNLIISQKDFDIQELMGRVARYSRNGRHITCLSLSL